MLRRNTIEARDKTFPKRKPRFFSGGDNSILCSKLLLLFAIMDPISIAASALTVAALAAKTCSALADLRSISQSLPGRLHALNNEVADLELVLFQLASLIKERACLPETKPSTIPYLLNQASNRLTELKNIVRRHAVNYQRTKISLTGATAWRKDHGRLQELQEDIKAVKSSLNIMLGASNPYVNIPQTPWPSHTSNTC
jgi:hypothetical protein